MADALPERRWLTVVFADIVGSMRLVQTLGDEAWHALLGQFFSKCDEIASKWGGYVAQRLGDGVLLYFGYPKTFEDIERRAIAASLEIADQVPTIRTPKSVPALQVRVGVQTGMALVATLGSGPKREILAVGPPPHEASRIQALAPPNTVLVSESTRNLAEGFYKFEPSDHQLVGVEGTSRLYRVIGATGAARSIDAATAIGLTDLVGRQVELSTLEKLWSRAVDGRTGAVLVQGEAGIGKSRLVQALRAHVANSPARILEWHCSPDAQATALRPVAEAIARHVDITDEDPSEERLKKLERGLRIYDDTLRLMASLLSHERPLATERQTIRKKTLEALLDILRALSAEQPLFLVVEDVHWADPSTLELFGLILESLQGRRVLLVLTARPEFRSTWATLEPVMHLERLPPAETLVMIRHLAGGRELPADELKDLALQSEGVPLFIEELTRAFLEPADRGSRDELVSPLEGVHMPPRIQASLMARFHRLGPSKRVAQVGSVLGRTFGYEMIRAVDAAGDAELQLSLGELVEADFLHAVGESDEKQWTFKHQLIRDVVFNSLLPKERRELHGKTASVLVERFPETVKAQPELVAYHFTQAGAPEKAVPHWIDAGDQALSRSANQEAVKCLTQGIEAVAELSESEERANYELTLRVMLGPALMATEGYSHPSVLDSYTRAQELLKHVGNAPQMFGVLWGLWAQHFVGGQLRAAREPAEQVVRMARASGNPGLLPPANHALGYVECYTAHYPETLKLVEEGRAVFDVERERQNCLTFQFASSLALMNMGATALWMLGKPDQARKLAAQALPLAEELGHLPSTAYAITSRSWVLQLAGDAIEVKRIMERVNELSEGEGFAFWPPLASVFGGWAMMAGGDLDGGEDVMLKSFSRYRAIGGGILRTHFFALLAEGLLTTGRISEALDKIDEALENARITGEVHFEPELHRVKGLALAKRAQQVDGSLDEARGALEHALGLAREQQARWLELRAAIDLAGLLRALGRPGLARETLAPIYESISEGHDTREMQNAATLLAELAGA